MGPLPPEVAMVVEHMEDIGFYTLSDRRCAEVSAASPLWRCELLVTDHCNFNCPYCQPLRPDCRGPQSFASAMGVVKHWTDEGLRNIRFSGGEPTLWRRLQLLVAYADHKGVERIAISSNGSASLDTYLALADEGVNDFSFSLDACCAGIGDRMAGRMPGVWKHVVEVIEAMAELTYVTVGVVVTSETVATLPDIVRFAHDLGVADIRVISAAQWNGELTQHLEKIPVTILDRHPILRYRVTNFLEGRNVRGLQDTDSHRCHLVLDDMAVAGGLHFPCIIYLRQGGDPIGDVGPGMRQQRARFFEVFDTHADPICRANCLDVCVDHNNRCRALQSATVNHV